MQTETKTTERPANTVALGFKSEHFDEDGHEYGPVYYVTSDGETKPVAITIWDDGATVPYWDSRIRTVNQARKMRLEFREL